MGDAKLLNKHSDMGASWHSMVLLQQEIHPQKVDRGYLFFQPEVNERNFWSEWVMRSSWTNILIWELLGTHWFCFKMNFKKNTLKKWIGGTLFSNQKLIKGISGQNGVMRSSWTNILIWELLGTQWFCFKMNFNENTLKKWVGGTLFQPEANERYFWSEWVMRSSWTNILIWELLGTHWFCFKMNFKKNTLKKWIGGTLFSNQKLMKGISGQNGWCEALERTFWYGSFLALNGFASKWISMKTPSKSG